MSELKDCQSDEFKKWLRSVCFQAPPKHCEDLACMAWQEAGRVAKTATDAEVERLREALEKISDASLNGWSARRMQAVARAALKQGD